VFDLVPELGSYQPPTLYRTKRGRAASFPLTVLNELPVGIFVPFCGY
jgi:hypothetical protein